MAEARTHAEDRLTPRERIYAAAVSCFERDGVARTSMDDIAEEAGMSRPAIYYYFESKQALVVEAVLRQMAMSHREYQKKLAKTRRGLDAVVEAAVLGATDARDDPFSALLTRDANRGLTAAALNSDASREVQQAFWGPLLADARSRGELRTDLDDAALIKWIIFVQFSAVSNGDLFGFTGDDDAVRQMMRAFLTPSLSRPV